MRNFIALCAIGIILSLLLVTCTAMAKGKKPPERSKFYDFSEQIIDGEIKKPTALYTDARKNVRFGRLLKLKKSFMPELFKSAKNSVFK